MAIPSSHPDWTRREFLALPLLAATACRRPYDSRAFAPMVGSAVAILPATSYCADFADVVFRGLRMLGVDVRQKRVLLKPNLVEYEDHSCINTNPAVIGGAAVAMLRAGAASVAVGEGPGHRRDVEYLLESSGLLDVLRTLRLPYVDLNHDDVRAVPLRSHFTGQSEILLPVSVLSADLVVSMPKLKTHHWTGMTCGMKNLFGAVPGGVYGWPKNLLHVHGIPESIVDLAATIRPGLTIVDGVIGMEGDGPIMGSARPLGIVAMSTDVVAADATCARVIGLDADRMPYLGMAGRFLGVVDAARIEQRGEPPKRYASRFAVGEHLRGLQRTD